MAYMIYDKESRTPKALITDQCFADIKKRTTFRPVVVNNEVRHVATTGFSYGNERAGYALIVQENDFFIGPT